jgi:hypothetical protein
MIPDVLGRSDQKSIFVNCLSSSGTCSKFGPFNNDVCLDGKKKSIAACRQQLLVLLIALASLGQGFLLQPEMLPAHDFLRLHNFLPSYADAYLQCVKTTLRDSC